MIFWIADLVALLATVIVWRVSRPIAVALGLSVAASIWQAFGGPEWLRWSSAIVGLAGVVELGHGARGLLPSPSLHGVIPGLPKRARIGAICIAGMAADGAAYIAWVRLAEWVQPVAQIVVCGLMVAVSAWMQRVSKT